VNAQHTARALRGLYAVTPDISDTTSLIDLTRAAITGGARVIQYRNKTAPSEVRLEQAQALKFLCARTGASLIVNDHVELASEVDADGVHVGSGDDSADEARRALGSRKLIGVSCYDSIELARAAADGAADYVAFGSFFPSHVKPEAVRAPVDLLLQAKRELRVPVVAIGGITLENAPRLIAAGADAIAVISALFAAPDVVLAAARFSALFEPRR
jgi:thiamine-phosphate pyrophosphorylase